MAGLALWRLLQAWFWPKCPGPLRSSDVLTGAMAPKAVTSRALTDREVLDLFCPVALGGVPLTAALTRVLFAQPTLRTGAIALLLDGFRPERRKAAYVLWWANSLHPETPVRSDLAGASHLQVAKDMLSLLQSGSTHVWLDTTVWRALGVHGDLQYTVRSFLFGLEAMQRTEAVPWIPSPICYASEMANVLNLIGEVDQEGRWETISYVATLPTFPWRQEVEDLLTKVFPVYRTAHRPRAHPLDLALHALSLLVTGRRVLTKWMAEMRVAPQRWLDALEDVVWNAQAKVVFATQAPTCAATTATGARSSWQ